MKVAHIFKADEPASIDSRNSVMRCTSVLAVMQAITTHTDAVVYSTTDSKIVEEAATLARKMGVPEDGIISSGDSVRIRNADGKWGSLTLRHAGQPSTSEDRNKHTELFHQLAMDEERNPSDIVNNHNEWFEGYLKDAGVKNVVFHLHMPLEYAKLKEEAARESAREVGCRLTEDGLIIPQHPVIALSQTHEEDCRRYGMDVLGHAYHGVLAPDKSEVIEERAGYLLSLGRLVPEKGAHHAIKIAQDSGKPLIIAGPVKPVDRAYFDKEIAPYVETVSCKSSQEMEALIASLKTSPMNAGGKPRIIYVGEVNDAQKAPLFKHADAFLFPMTEPEALGLTNLEAMSYGTLVIGFASSVAVKEVIKEEQGTGYIVEGNAEEAIKESVRIIKAGSLSGVNHTRIREVFDTQWSAPREARDVVALYGQFKGRVQNQGITPQVLGPQYLNNVAAMQDNFLPKSSSPVVVRPYHQFTNPRIREMLKMLDGGGSWLDLVKSGRGSQQGR